MKTCKFFYSDEHYEKGRIATHFAYLCQGDRVKIKLPLLFLNAETFKELDGYEARYEHISNSPYYNLYFFDSGLDGLKLEGVPPANIIF